MKHRLLPVFAALFLCSWSITAFACEHEKKTTAAAAEASKAAAYTKAVTADAKSSCGARTTTAVVTSSKASCGAHAMKTATADGSACKAFGASLVTASNEACAGKSVKAAVASTGHGCCAGKDAKGTKSTMAARAPQVDAVVAGSSCQAGAKLTKGDHNCDACAELATCDEELSRIGIETQVVPLKNGVMIVYTASKAGKAHAVQAAMARRNDRLHTLTAMGDQAKLCNECSAMRGAMASGKLTRETVNIGGGVLTVMTSEDPAMVAKLQGMSEQRKT